MPSKKTSLIDQSVGILGLGGYEADPDRLARSLSYFQARGMQTVLLPLSSQKHQRFAASDEGRLAALDQFMAHPHIGIVMALRGGYGLTRLLDRIDFAAVARSVRQGKRYVGHSDFTVFHLALLALTGAVSYAGPMAYDFGVDTTVQPVSTFTESHFWTMMEQGRDGLSFSTDHAPSLQASGTLWGGNLAMVCSLLGTPWMPQIDNGILFLEDIYEQPYRIERLLLQLHQSGVLKKQKAILLGDFSGYRLHDYDNGYDLASMLSYLRGVIQVPLIDGLPFGHGRDKLTLPVGGMAEIVVSDGSCQLSMTA